MVDFEVGWRPESSRKRQVLAAFIVSTGALCIGSAIGWMDPALKDMSKTEHFGHQLTHDEQIFLVISVIIGAALGYPVAMLLLRRMGRRISLLSISVTLILAWIIIACADSLIILYCGRAISGLCAEGIAVIIPIYVHEISGKSPPQFLKYLHISFVYIGILFSFAVGMFVDWLWLSVACAMIPMSYICCLVYMPETPHYLLTFGKHRYAQKSLAWLNGATDSFDVNQDLSEIKLQLDEEGLAPSFGINFNEILKPSFIKSIVISTFLTFLQVYSGIVVLIFFPTDILKWFYVYRIMSNDMALIFVASALTLGVIISLFQNEGSKHKMALSISCIGTGTFMGILGICTHLGERNEDDTAVSWIGLISLCGFAGFYGIGLSSGPWSIMQNITPVKYRGWIYGAVNTLKWGFAFLAVEFFHESNQLMGLGTFWIFSGINLIGFMIVYFILPRYSSQQSYERTNS